MKNRRKSKITERIREAGIEGSLEPSEKGKRPCTTLMGHNTGDHPVCVQLIPTRTWTIRRENGRVISLLVNAYEPV
jgi:hypothetical protein